MLPRLNPLPSKMADSNKFSFYESPESVQVFTSCVDEVEISSIEVSGEDGPEVKEFIEVVEEEKIEFESVVFSSATSPGNGDDSVPIVTEPCNDMHKPEETFSDCVSMVTEASKNDAKHTDIIKEHDVVEEEERNDVDVIAADVENRPGDNESIESTVHTDKIIDITSNTSNLSLGRSLESANSGDSSVPSVERTPSLEKGVFRIDNIRTLLQNELTRGEYIYYLVIFVIQSSSD